ncbi:hypothetical protein QYZ45_17555 [Vibrio parahaemolyticus]|nr:hypothetical protein [Vibrio parahaemolyticus]
MGWDITDSKESKAMLTSTLDMTLKKTASPLSELQYARHTCIQPASGGT